MIGELALILIGSLLGSAHCVGMCGGFVLTIGMHSPNARTNLLRQLIFSLGRLLTYCFLGMIVWLGGNYLIRQGSQLFPWQAVLALAAGILLIVQGLQALGVKITAFWPKKRCSESAASASSNLLPILDQPAPGAGCGIAKLYRGLLIGGSPGHVLLAGCCTGLLPCGLVYAFLALAAGRTQAWESAAIMLVFGLGTIPLLTATGLFGGWCSIRWRKQIWRLAAICLVLSGVLSCWRGVLAWQASQPAVTETQQAAPVKACPFCKE
jgi:uncharacterized protein